MIIFDPRSKNAGKKLRSSSLTGNIDFAPTILELAGLPIPKNIDGVSLLPLLDDPTKRLRTQMSFINTFGPAAVTSLSILTQEWKYTYWWYGNEKMKPQEELYNLVKDPLEMTNFAVEAEAKDALEEIRKKYDTALAHWKAEAAPNGKYDRYVTRFDRHIPWQEKKLKSKKRTNK